MNRTIQKVKLTKENFVEIDYDFTQEGAQKSDVPLKGFSATTCKWDAHPDLKRALDALRVHLVILCEQVPMPAELTDVDKDILSAYRVTGITNGGEGEHAGVTIVGQRRLKGKRVLNLVAPFTKYEGDDPYRFHWELQEAVAEVEVEGLECLDGKRAHYEQGSFDFGEPEQKDPKQLAAPQKQIPENV